MPGRGWEDREIDIVAGDDIFHHRPLLMYSTGKSAAWIGCVKHARRLVMMLGTADELLRVRRSANACWSRGLGRFACSLHSAMIFGIGCAKPQRTIRTQIHSVITCIDRHGDGEASRATREVTERRRRRFFMSSIPSSGSSARNNTPAPMPGFSLEMFRQ